MPRTRTSQIRAHVFATAFHVKRLLVRRMQSALGRLAWLLEFARRPPGVGLRGRALMDLQEQILMFCNCQAGVHFASDLVRQLGTDTMLGLQREVQVGINSYLYDRTGGWLLPRVKQRLVRDPRTGSGRFELTGAPKELFLQFAASLVAAEGARIANCARPGCDNLFVCRKRGAYCSKRCSQYVRTKRYRESHLKIEGGRA